MEAAVSTIWVDCGGRQARAEVRGEGPPVLIVSAALPNDLADPLASSLVGEGLRVINVDYARPAGWEGEPEGRTCAALAEDGVAVLDALEVERAHVIGISRGSVAAYALAARHPERVERLVLVTPMSPFAPRLNELPQEQADVPATPEEARAAFLQMIHTAGFLEHHRTAAEGLLDAVMAGNGTVVRVPREAEEPVGRDERVAADTLVVIAGDDRVVPRDDADDLLDELPDAWVAEVPGAAHGLPIEQPSACARLFATFLRTGVPGGAEDEDE